MSENNLNKSLHCDLMLFPYIMQTIFLQQDNAISCHQYSLTELLDFHALNYVLTYMHVLFLRYYEAHTKY